jgi:hypothetical protein
MAAAALNASTDVAEVRAFEQKNAEQLNSAVLAETYAPDAVVLDYMSRLPHSMIRRPEMQS